MPAGLYPNQPGFFMQQPAFPGPGPQTKKPPALKLFIVIGCFLVVGGVASFFLLRYPTYLVVSWVVLVIICSNILNQELRPYYRAGVEQALTTIQMTTMRITHRRRPQNNQRHPDLRSITDTTAYLQVLRQVFQQGRKGRTR